MPKRRAESVEMEKELLKEYPAKAVKGKSVEEALAEYQARYSRSINDPEGFWRDSAQALLAWQRPFDKVMGGDLLNGDVHWFTGGLLNACYNCLDRHMPHRADQTAIIWEADEPGEGRKITYSELFREVCRITNVMAAAGVRKGDVVTLYMPMIPELAMVMLACCRLGAVHSVVFAGFSSDSLRDRIRDCNSNFIFTANEGLRGGRSLRLKDTVDAAVAQCPDVQKVFVFKRTAGEVNMAPNRDLWMHETLPLARAYAPCALVDSEDPIFILYTSGSTGKPKGVLHSTAGYLLNATLTTKESFDLREGDIFCCAADCGWITGHSYIVYGPLSNGSTTVMFESVPTYPNPYRYWDLVQTYKITQFYTAPTAVRALMRHPTDPIAGYDLSSLRVIASVGEPINPEAWRWYYQNVGGGNTTLVDTYWQTETGAHLAANLPGAISQRPGSCTMPCYGIDLCVLDATSGAELQGNGVEGVLCIRQPWPSMARTVYGDHDRFLNVYLRPYKGYYFTGDGCRRDADGFYWITGRVDDVINPSGHRLGTAEIESALVAVREVSEAAVVGFPHELKGEGIGCYIILKAGIEGSETLAKSLKTAVRSAIGPIATPDFIVFSDLPKTRSGKIMRRILRKIAAGEEGSIGDTSTLADPSVVPILVRKFKDATSK
jgi:acetyl-CoA synthetase